MAVTDFPGQSVVFPAIPGFSVNPSLSASFSILGDNASDQLAFIGRVRHAARTGNKNISKVHFLFGSVTKSNGSTLRVSLQDVDLVNGPVIRPDGTVDQSVTIANADANFASNTWYTATLGATRTVAHGDLISVVFDWGSPASGDLVVIAGMSISSAQSNGGAAGHQNCCVQFTAAAWSVVLMMPNVILEFDDGTFGTLEGSYPVSGVGSINFKSDSTPDENALEFIAPFTGEIDSMYCLINPATNSFDMVLYEGTTALATVTVDGNATQASSARWTRVNFPKVAVTAGQTYRVAVKATSASSNMALYYTDLNNAAHRSVFAFGTDSQLNSRTDAGSWGAGTATRRPLIGVGYSGIDVTPPDITNLSGSYAFVG